MTATPATTRSQNGRDAKQAPRAPWSGLHSSRIRYRFKVPVMDFFLQWLLGGQTHGATEVGESWYAAGLIKDGDPQSWVRSWEGLAERVEARGRASLAAGHLVSARESLLRAYSYHRAPLAFLSPLKEPEQVKARYARARACFRDACKLFDPPIEEVTIPFEGKALPGYFLSSGPGNAPRKTLLMIGGGDTFVEDLYGYIGPAALKRGYNMLMVDLPQQGILPFDGLLARADYRHRWAPSWTISCPVPTWTRTGSRCSGSVAAATWRRVRPCTRSGSVPWSPCRCCSTSTRCGPPAWGLTSSPRPRTAAC